MTRGERIVKRKGLLFFIVMLLSSSMIGTVSAAPKLRIMVNNSSVDVGVQIVSGKTLVPLKAFERFKNTSIQWDANTKQATIARDSMKIKLAVGSRTAWKNSDAVQLDVSAKIVDGRVAVPLRFIAEALGARVTVDAATNTVWVQERANAKLVQNYNSNDLVVSRIAALQFPVEEREPSKLTGDNEALSMTYYFPEGRSDDYFILYGHFVKYYEIKDNIVKLVWEADLDMSKEATNKDFTAIFGYPVAKEYGKAPVLAPSYASFYTSVWGSQIIYGMVNADGTTKVSGQSLYWGNNEPFVVAIPGETKL
jgi:hypothetical protein